MRLCVVRFGAECNVESATPSIERAPCRLMNNREIDIAALMPEATCVIDCLLPVTVCFAWGRTSSDVVIHESAGRCLLGPSVNTTGEGRLIPGAGLGIACVAEGHGP